MLFMHNLIKFCRNIRINFVLSFMCIVTYDRSEDESVCNVTAYCVYLSLSLSLSAAVRENEWTVRERETESMTELMKDGI